MSVAPSQPPQAHPTATLRVVLADRDGTARRALAGLLTGLDGVTLAATVGDGAELGVVLRESRADVLVLDDRLLSDGDHLRDRLGPQPASLRIFVLGVDDNPAFAQRARRLGAEAWIAKDYADEQLSALLAR